MTASNQVKTVKKYSAPIKSMLRAGSEQGQEEILVLLAEYNDKQLLVSETKFDLSGELEEVHTYTYDERANLLLHLLEIPADGISERFETTRNTDGNALVIVKYYGDDPGERTEYEYGSNALPLKVLRMDADGEFEASEELQYDEQSRLISRKIRSVQDGEKEYRFRYDEKGRLTEEEELGKDGKRLGRVLFEYDEEGRESMVSKLNADDKLISRQTSHYDELGRLVQKVSKGFYTRITSYEYDELGRLTEESLADENGYVISRNRMAYDEEGRLCEETVYETDLTRAGRDTHLSNRYEYEFF
ncbi:MAG: RHS repeat protein [Bacteroidia bacterium]|nr:RHS repeat protein [Bacteroidia bacterium]